MCNSEKCKECKSCSNFCDCDLALRLKKLLEFYFLSNYCGKDVLEEFYIDVLEQLNMTDEIEKFLERKENHKDGFVDIESEID